MSDTATRSDRLLEAQDKLQATFAEIVSGDDWPMLQESTLGRSQWAATSARG